MEMSEEKLNTELTKLVALTRDYDRLGGHERRIAHSNQFNKLVTGHTLIPAAELEELRTRAANPVLATKETAIAYAESEDQQPVKVVNAPEKIWLCFGDLSDVVTPTVEYHDVYREGDVSWCENPIDDTDVMYVRADELDALYDKIGKFTCGECVCSSQLHNGKHWPGCPQTAQNEVLALRARVKELEALMSKIPIKQIINALDMLDNERLSKAGQAMAQKPE